MNIFELTQARYNGNTFPDKYTLHLFRNHGVEDVNLLQSSGNLPIIVMTCKDNLR